MGFWANGGHSAGSGIRPSEVFESGFRLGVVLLDQHGHGWYRGALEYSADFIPVLLLRAQDRTAYGISFNPVLLRWNFTNHRKISPFFEMGAGVVLTNHVIPEFGSDFNFSPQGQLGLNFFRDRKHAWSLALKYMHMSNAATSSFNPGFNFVEGSVGYHWFR